MEVEEEEEDLVNVEVEVEVEEEDLVDVEEEVEEEVEVEVQVDPRYLVHLVRLLRDDFLRLVCSAQQQHPLASRLLWPLNRVHQPPFNPGTLSHCLTHQK